MDRNQLQLYRRLRIYQATAIFSVLFALAGFSYNVWRMEVSEANNNIRTASFEILLELSTLEQLIYTAHYDGDLEAGSPRKGWVRVGLILDLSVLTGSNVIEASDRLRETWSNHWHVMPDQRDSVETLVGAIDAVRTEIKQILTTLP